jgi:hypothetical protein
MNATESRTPRPEGRDFVLGRAGPEPKIFCEDDKGQARQVDRDADFHPTLVQSQRPANQKAGGEQRKSFVMNTKHIRRSVTDTTTPSPQTQYRGILPEDAVIAREVEVWQLRRKELEREFALRQDMARKAGRDERYRELLVLLLVLLSAVVGGCGHIH